MTDRDRIDVTIRGHRDSDLADLEEIHRQPGAIAGTNQLPYREESELRARYAEHRDDLHRLVAVVQDGERERVVGRASLHVFRRRRSHVAGVGMFVHDAWQGRGVGNALMAALVELAEDWLGIERLELSVYVDNVPAIALYEKFGFEVEGTLRRYARRAGEFVDCLAMARLRPRD